jgi:hypothetical protein
MTALPSDVDRTLAVWIPYGRVTILDSQPAYARAMLSICADLAKRAHADGARTTWTAASEGKLPMPTQRGLYIANFISTTKRRRTVDHDDIAARIGALDSLAARYDSRILAVFTDGAGHRHIDPRIGYIAEPFRLDDIANVTRGRADWTLAPYWLDPRAEPKTAALRYSLDTSDPELTQHDLYSVTWHGVVFLERSPESRQP